MRDEKEEDVLDSHLRHLTYHTRPSSSTNFFEEDDMVNFYGRPWI